MATTVVIVPTSRRVLAPSLLAGPAYSFLLTAGLSLLALLVQGYHPFAEDGGLYLAGVKYLLNPALYPSGTEFVTAHLRYSLFAPLLAEITRTAGLSLGSVVFLLYFASIWLTLASAWHLACQCFATTRERSGSVLLLACWMSLPVAGTSLMLVDPYLTARSFSTPCVLFALAFALRFRAEPLPRPRDLAWSIVWLVLAAIVHPLMAGYGVIGVAALLLYRTSRPNVLLLRTLCFLGAGVLFATLLQHFSPAGNAAANAAALSRDYWYPSEWRWFELLGLAAPVCVLWGFSLRARGNLRTIVQSVIAVSLVLGILALCFARTGLNPKAVARLQPLRTFQLTYIVMIVVLGATLARLLLRERPWRWVAAALLLGAPMFFAERSVYSNSPHLEFDTASTQSAPRNSWTAAFLWISRNTPSDAVFALDPDYINRPHEDAHSFRALAERSMLPDLSKDGGEAAITPRLAAAWQAGVAAQRGLSTESDAERRRKLSGSGVSWLVLDAAAGTGLPCPYRNALVKVCRLTAAE